MTTKMRSSPAPSVQYVRPRPELLESESMMSNHRTSSPVGRQGHSGGPVAAAIATTSRLIPAVVYITPLTISGLTCIAGAGRGPKFRADQRHATRRSFTLAAVIWLAGDYRVAQA